MRIALSSRLRHARRDAGRLPAIRFRRRWSGRNGSVRPRRRRLRLEPKEL